MTRFAIGMLLLSGASAASAQTDFGVRTVSGQRGVVSIGTHQKVSQQQFTGQTPVAHEAALPRETYTPLLGGVGNGSLRAAAGIGSSWGRVTSTYRTPEHNRRVGGVRNSWHTHGRAIDIARRPGVTHLQIAAAFRNAGYRLIESLDEGDHSHFAFAFGGSGGTRIAASMPTKHEMTQWGVVTVSSALLR
jgi:opacity protein-like surface antigen